VDPAPAIASLHGLLEDPCFEAVRYDPWVPDKADSGLALRSWWTDGGGQRWLEVALPPDGNDGKTDPAFAVLAARVPPTLTPETRQGHPLAPLLCHASHPDCSAEAAAWRWRAEKAMAALFAQNALLCGLTRWEGAAADEAVFTHEECQRAVEKAPNSEKYAVWRECESHGKGRHPVFPIGGPRPPQTGWLTITHGPAMTYPLCTLTTHYELGTGLALRSEVCDEGARRPLKRTYEVGTASMASMSEALWMLLVVPEMGPIDGDGWIETSLPAGVPLGGDPLWAGAGALCSTIGFDVPVTGWRWSESPLAADANGVVEMSEDQNPPQVYAETLLTRAKQAACASIPSRPRRCLR
jgi:hypothetical protein